MMTWLLINLGSLGSLNFNWISAPVNVWSLPEASQERICAVRKEEAIPNSTPQTWEACKQKSQSDKKYMTKPLYRCVFSCILCIVYESVCNKISISDTQFVVLSVSLKVIYIHLLYTAKFRPASGWADLKSSPEYPIMCSRCRSADPRLHVSLFFLSWSWLGSRSETRWLSPIAITRRITPLENRAALRD